MPLRGLTAEQLFDSLATATGYRDSGVGNDLFAAIQGGARSGRSEFVTKFTNLTERPVEAQRRLSRCQPRGRAASASIQARFRPERSRRSDGTAGHASG